MPRFARPGALTALPGALVVLLAVGCGSPANQAAPDSSPTSASAAAAAPTSATPSSAPAPTSAPAPSRTPSPKPPAAPPAKPRPAALMSQGDSGEKVRELQHRLRQLDWYAGLISGRYLDSTVSGVKGFQEKRNLESSGAVDATTWSRLVAMTR